MRKFRKVAAVVARGRRRSEKGAYAVLMSMTLVLVIALAAISVDIASQVASKQELKDTMDAAAHAGALKLDSGAAAAITAAQETAARNGYDGVLAGSAWCVVAAVKVGGVNQPTASQLPGTCNPGLGLPWTKSRYPATVCSDTHCFIPCDRITGQCNTVRLEGQRDVNFAFAPAIGHDKGSTGAVVSVACKGSCGKDTPNPLDIVVVADRTPSMGDDLPELRTSMRGMLPTMDPDMHFLALATIDAAVQKPTTAALLTSTSCPTSSTANHKPRVDEGRSPTADDVKRGSWMATQFSNTYVTKAGEARTINDRDRVSNAMKCLDFSRASSGSSYFMTHLAAPLRQASQYLWDESASNLRTLSNNASRPGEVRKVIIFETDGAPREVRTQTGDLNVSTVTPMGPGEPRHQTASNACDNLKRVARAAKDKGTIIVTVGFGAAATDNCGSQPISKVLADVATDSATSGCDSPAKRSAENNDGDYFFCATTGAELGPIFRTAFAQLATGVKFLKMPA